VIEELIAKLEAEKTRMDELIDIECTMKVRKRDRICEKHCNQNIS
jgi:hypothetical protein